MARTTDALLDSGDAFPALAFDTVAHGQWQLPERFADRWGVLLVYRAHW